MELSIGEMLVIVLVIVVLFGPDKIPSIARELGQGIRKMKGAMEDIKTEIMKETDNPLSDIKKEVDNIKKSLGDINPMNDVQKQIGDMNNSLNQNNNTSSSSEKNSSTFEETKDTKDNKPSDAVDPLSDEYTGSVSRKNK